MPDNQLVAKYYDKQQHLIVNVVKSRTRALTIGGGESHLTREYLFVRTLISMHVRDGTPYYVHPLHFVAS